MNSIFKNLGFICLAGLSFFLSHCSKPTTHFNSSGATSSDYTRCQTKGKDWMFVTDLNLLLYSMNSKLPRTKSDKPDNTGFCLNVSQEVKDQIVHCADKGVDWSWKSTPTIESDNFYKLSGSCTQDQKSSLDYCLEKGPDWKIDNDGVCKDTTKINLVSAKELCQEKGKTWSWVQDSAQDNKGTCVETLANKTLKEVCEAKGVDWHIIIDPSSASKQEICTQTLVEKSAKDVCQSKAVWRWIESDGVIKGGHCEQQAVASLIGDLCSLRGRDWTFDKGSESIEASCALGSTKLVGMELCPMNSRLNFDSSLQSWVCIQDVMTLAASELCLSLGLDKWEYDSQTKICKQKMSVIAADDLCKSLGEWTLSTINGLLVCSQKITIITGHDICQSYGTEWVFDVLTSSCKSNSSQSFLSVCSTLANPSSYATKGNGSEIAPYLICNIEQLKDLATTGCGASSAVSCDKNFRLMADIDAQSITLPPIGLGQTFSGSFDGAGHKIMNLKISSSTEKVGGELNMGLFSVLSKSGVIKNLSLQNTSLIRGGDTTGVARHIGGLVGKNNGNISGIHMTQLTLNCSNCQIVGGIVGQNNIDGIINYAFSKVDFVGILIQGEQVANNYDGLVGQQNGELANSIAFGSIK